MKPYLRWITAVLVVLYMAWVAYPVVKACIFPGVPDANVPTMAQDDNDYTSGLNAPMDSDAGLQTMTSIQGETALDAIASHNLPVVYLWGAVLVLYAAAALLHAAGNLRAALVYGIGFVADAILTYITNGNPGEGLYEKLLNVLSGWDPRYVLTLVAMVLGFIIYMARYWPEKKTASAHA